MNTKGLFQTDNLVGIIFPIYRVPNQDHKCEPTPCHNTDDGQASANEIAKHEDFVCWAIDPWTSKINITLVQP